MKSSKGFSLLETMVVIGLIGILTAIAIPQLIIYRNNAKFRDAVSMIQADFEKARSRAVRENAHVAVEINTNTNTNAYKICIDNGFGGGTANNRTCDGNEKILCDASLPAGIKISQTTFTGNKTGFNGRGYIINNGYLTVVDSSVRSAKIDMTNRFGRITIQ